MYLPVSHLPQEIKGQKIVYFAPVTNPNSIATRTQPPSTVQSHQSIHNDTHKPYTTTTSPHVSSFTLRSSDRDSSPVAVQPRPVTIRPSGKYVLREQRYAGGGDKSKATVLRSDLDLVRSGDVKYKRRRKSSSNNNNNNNIANKELHNAHAWHEKNRRVKERWLYKKLNTVLNLKDGKKATILTESASRIKKLAADEFVLLQVKRNLSVEALLKLRRFSVQLRNGNVKPPPACETHQESATTTTGGGGRSGMHLSDVLEVFLDNASAIDTAEVSRVVKGLCYKCYRVYPNENNNSSSSSSSSLVSESGVPDREDVASLSGDEEMLDSQDDELDEYDNTSASQLGQSPYTPSSSSRVSRRSSTAEESGQEEEEESDSEDLKRKKRRRIALVDEAERGLNIDDVIFAMNTYHTLRRSR